MDKSGFQGLTKASKILDCKLSTHSMLIHKQRLDKIIYKVYSNVDKVYNNYTTLILYRWQTKNNMTHTPKRLIHLNVGKRSQE